MIIGEKNLIAYWGRSREQRIATGFTGGKSLLVDYWGEDPDLSLGRLSVWGHAAERYWISGSGSRNGVSRDTVSSSFDVIGYWSVFLAQLTIKCVRPAMGR